MEHISIADTFGAMFVGGLITMSVYGITTLQMYFYYTQYPRDNIQLKILVATIWTLDTFHVILMCHALYHYLIDGFGNPHALVEGTWSLYLSIAVNILMSFVVQCFFTQRIHSLCPQRHRLWLSTVIALAVVAHFIFGIETVVYFFIIKKFDRLKEANYQSVLPFAIMAILSDILIAVSLCVILDSNRSSFADTNSIINKLIVYAINRCVLTSAVAVTEVVIFVALPHSFYSFAFDFIIGKLYANSLLATLNSRRSLRGKGQDSSVSQGTSTSLNLGSIVSDRTRPSFIEVVSRDSEAQSTDAARRRTAFDPENKPDVMTPSPTLDKGNPIFPTPNF